MSYKFSIGQPVIFVPSFGEQTGGAMRGAVTRLMPTQDGRNQYRVHLEPDGPDRRAWESQIRALPGAVSSH